jgi:hypothetical protein
MYIAFVTLAILLCGQQHLAHLNALFYLQSLDRLLAIRQVIYKPPDQSHPLTKFEVPAFFHLASEEAMAPWPNNQDPHQVELIEKRGFTREAVPQSYVKDDVAMRGDAGTCAAAIVTLLPGTKFNFATFEVVGKTYWVNSENTQFVTLSCDNDEAFAFFIFHAGSDDVVGIPEDFQQLFPGLSLPPPFKSFELYQLNELKQQLPQFVRKYATLKKPFVVMHLRAVEHAILSYANQKSARLYSLSDFDLAVDNLYQEKEGRTQFYGMAFDLLMIIRLIPLILFLLAWEMWRRLRQLPQRIFETKVYWTPLDTNDALGRAAAIFYAVVPLAAGIAAMWTFAVSQGLGLRIGGGYMLTLTRGVVEEGVRWPDYADWLAASYLVPTVLFVCVLSAISFRLVLIAKAGAQSAPATRSPWRRAALKKNRKNKR